LGFSVNLRGKHLHYAYLNNPDLEYRHFLALGFTFGSLTPSLTPPSEVGEPLRNLQLEQSPTDDGKDAASPTEQIANRYSLEVELILAMIKTESSFNPKAISSSGAVGLTQLMPPTAQDLGLKVPTYRNIRKPQPNSAVDERFDPRKNLEAGVRYLSLMLKKYDGNYVLALAAYNAGPANVRKNVPLIRETERHVGKVLNYYYQYKAGLQLKDAALQKLDAVLAGAHPDF
jgi:soluble lytic murein transglycosylase-like protein